MHRRVASCCSLFNTLSYGSTAGRFGITRAHLEEDAGKNVHGGADSLSGSSHTLVDYNRAGGQGQAQARPDGVVSWLVDMASCDLTSSYKVYTAKLVQEGLPGHATGSIAPIYMPVSGVHQAPSKRRLARNLPAITRVQCKHDFHQTWPNPQALWSLRYL